MSGNPPNGQPLLLDHQRLSTLALDLWAVIGTDGVVRQVNAACTATLGWSAEDLVGRPRLELVHPEDHPLIQDQLSCLLNGAPFHNVEVRDLCREGSYRWISWIAQLLTDEQLIVAVGRDVTQTRRKAFLLERASAAARIGGWEVDCLTGELFWTEQTYRIHETSPQEYSPTVDTSIAFYALESRPIITEAVRRGLATGEPWDLELELITARGRRVVVRATGEAERQGDRTTKLFGSFQDVTVQRRACEEQLQLEARIQQAQKLDSLGVLAGGVAHDFNNLLTGILGHADLALMQLPATSPVRASLDQVLIGATRAGDLTKQLLAYSGKGKFVVQPLNLSGLLREMGHLLQVSISKKISLRYHFTADLPLIEGDSTQLRQIAMNLILNAAEAVGDRAGLIVVSTGFMHCHRDYLSGGFPAEERIEGPYVFLGVADTGCGMTEEVRARIFDPFFTTKFAGRGLGLAAVLGIVRGHKGTIKLQSDPGRGTTFKVLFPALRGTALPVEQPRAPVRDWHETGTVLVVDDEVEVRGLAEAMLRCMGFTVLKAADGREGVETFRHHADDVRLVLLDLTMPELDGEAAFREILAIRSDARVLLSSGFNQPEGANRLIGEGLAGFIQKPYRYEQLVEAVRLALGAARRDEEKPQG
jgi:PAS domain S-box-containing protein